MVDINIDEAVAATYKKLFQRKARFMTVKVDKVDEHDVVCVDVAGEKTATFDDFLAAMPQDECRFAAYNLEWTHEERLMEKVVFIFYSPDTVKDKKARFTYAQYKDKVQQKMDNSARTFQINDHADLKESDF